MKGDGEEHSVTDKASELHYNANCNFHETNLCIYKLIPYSVNWLVFELIKVWHMLASAQALLRYIL